MPALFTPDLDFQLLFGALPAPHAVLAPTGTVLGLNAAASALLNDDARAGMVVNQPLCALHAALTAAGHVLAPTESWTAALHAAQSGSPQVLAPRWQPAATGQRARHRLSMPGTRVTHVVESAAARANSPAAEPRNDTTPRRKPFRTPGRGLCHFKGLSCVRYPWR